MKNIIILFLTISFIYMAPTKKIYNVEGMFCGVGCVNMINNTIKSLNGVESVNVDFPNKTMEVVFDDENINSENIIGSLPNPYKATFVKETISKEYMVSGMTCMGCVNSIRSSINDLEGLEHYDVNFEKDMLYIEFDVNKIDDEKILSQIPEKFKVVEIVSIDKDQSEENKNLEN